MPLGDALDDRKAEAGAGALRRRAAVEAVEHPLALVRRYAGTAVLDLEQRLAAARVDAHLHRAAFGRVAQRVVDQVAEQGAPRIGVAGDRRRRGAIESQIDAPRMRHRLALGNHLARERREIDRLSRARRVRVEARQGEQLLGEVRSAQQALAQRAQRLVALGVIGRALDELRLQPERGERRAQLVRHVGDEAPLRAERALQAREQVVHRMHRRLDLARQAVERERLERVGAAAPDVGGERAKRREPAADAEPHRERDQRHEQEEGRDVAQRDIGAQPEARALGLRDLHHARSPLRGVDAPAAAARVDARKSGGGQERQLAVGLRYVHQAVGAVPQLHQQLAVFALARVARDRDGEQVLVAQRQRGLLELVVEQVVHFLARLPVARRARDGERERESGEQPAEQPRANRPHCTNPIL